MKKYFSSFVAASAVASFAAACGKKAKVKPTKETVQKATTKTKTYRTERDFYMPTSSDKWHWNDNSVPNPGPAPKPVAKPGKPPKMATKPGPKPQVVPNPGSQPKNPYKELKEVGIDPNNFEKTVTPERLNKLSEKLTNKQKTEKERLHQERVAFEDKAQERANKDSWPKFEETPYNLDNSLTQRSFFYQGGTVLVELLDQKGKRVAYFVSRYNPEERNMENKFNKYVKKIKATKKNKQTKNRLYSSKKTDFEKWLDRKDIPYTWDGGDYLTVNGASIGRNWKEFLFEPLPATVKPALTPIEKYLKESGKKITNKYESKGSGYKWVWLENDPGQKWDNGYSYDKKTGKFNKDAFLHPALETEFTKRDDGSLASSTTTNTLTGKKVVSYYYEDGKSLEERQTYLGGKVTTEAWDEKGVLLEKSTSLDTKLETTPLTHSTNKLKSKSRVKKALLTHQHQSKGTGKRFVWFNNDPNQQLDNFYTFDKTTGKYDSTAPLKSSYEQYLDKKGVKYQVVGNDYLVLEDGTWVGRLYKNFESKSLPKMQGPEQDSANFELHTHKEKPVIPSYEITTKLEYITKVDITRKTDLKTPKRVSISITSNQPLSEDRPKLDKPKNLAEPFKKLVVEYKDLTGEDKKLVDANKAPKDNTFYHNFDKNDPALKKLQNYLIEDAKNKGLKPPKFKRLATSNQPLSEDRPKPKEDEFKTKVKPTKNNQDTLYLYGESLNKPVYALPPKKAKEKLNLAPDYQRKSRPA